MEGGPCALCQELEEFDRESQEILVGFTEQRREILGRINERHDPFIQRLPLELASQVFTFYLPQQPVFVSTGPYISLLWDASKKSHIKPFNIVLGSICQSWRRIAWSTPNLWSILPIRLHQQNTQSRVDLTLEWLRRSVQIPLDVVVYDSTATSEELTEENVGLWMPLIDIVNGCSSRWRKFTVDAPELVCSYIVGNGEATSILECLKFGDTYSRRFSTGFSLTNALPIPTELVLSSPVPLRLIVIGWSNLTSVRFTGLYVNECLALLQRACHLTTFLIDQLLLGRDEFLPAPAPTTHNTLEHFDIFGLDEEHTAQQLLDSLILPSLVELSYDSAYNSLDNVSAFLQRSGCRLTELRITGQDPDYFSEVAPASGLQALESLEYHGYLDPFLRCLNRSTNSDSNSLFLPNLHRLVIWGEPKNWSDLADLFLSRPLKTLSIQLHLDIDLEDETSWVDKEIALRFQDLVEKGHDIKIMGRLKGEMGEDRDLLLWFIKERMLEARNND